MADRDGDAEPGEPPRDGARGDVGARHLIPLRREHFRDPAHAGTADADEMNTFDLVLHRAFDPSAMHASATRSAASRRPTPRAAIAIARSVSRVNDESCCARRCGVSSDCAIRIAAPALTRNAALALCSSAIAPGSGTTIARDAGGCKLRDRHRTAAAKHDVGLGVAGGDLVDERDALGGDAGGGVRCAQRVDVLFARLVDDARAHVRRHERERRRHAFVQPGCAEASAHDQQPQRTAAPGKAHFRRRHARDRVAQRIADPLDFRRMPTRERLGKADEDPIRTVGENTIRKARDRVGFVQHERARRRHTHQRAGERCKAAEAQHDVRRPPPDDLEALAAGGEQRERSEHELAQSFAADAGEGDTLEGDAVLRDELRFHPALRPDPEHAPVAGGELRGDGEPGEDVAAGAAGGDHT